MIIDTWLFQQIQMQLRFWVFFDKNEGEGCIFFVKPNEQPLPYTSPCSF